MKKIPKKRTNALIAQMHLAAEGGGIPWDKWCTDEGSRPAVLWLATGEVLNPEIEGFVWGWKARGAISTGHKIPPHSSLVAQGMEGLVRIETDLNVALMVIDEVSTERGFIEI